MKKKAWDITVKDNPNRVVMGENDEFYTTDTEAYLVFKLEDESFNPASAVLTLENRNDGSLKNETVDVVDGLIEWEMPQRYIEHFGNWQGQLVYEDTKDGQQELYTSAPFSFVVNAHIGDKKKPSLVEIENWEKFIREGTELIETWEDMEDLRQANEAQRQANYQELLDTGVLQTNINQKLAEAEQEYAPRLTELEQNDENLTAQFAQTESRLDSKKIDKGNASVSDINKNLGKFDGTYFSDEFLTELNGGTVSSTVVQPKSITSEKLADKAVSTKNTDFFTQGKNLFDKNDVTQNVRISGTEGIEITVQGISTSGHIRVIGGKNIHRNVTDAYAVFSQDGQVLSGGNSASSDKLISLPENAYTIRLSVPTASLDVLQLEYGDSFTGYEKFKGVLSDDISVTEKSLPQVKPEKTTFFELQPAGRNLFDISRGIKGKQVTADGTLADSHAGNYDTTHPINVEGESVVYISAKSHAYYLARSFVFLDSFDNVIEFGEKRISENSGSLTVPQNAKTLLLSYSSDAEDLQIEFNDYNPFEPYKGKLVIPNEYLPKVENDNGLDFDLKSINNSWYGKKVVWNGDSITDGYGAQPPFFRDIVANNLGMTSVNYAIGGSMIGVDEDDPQRRNPIVLRYDEMDDDADLVIIAGGTNDNGNVPLGTFDDRTNYTFYGAMHNLCLGLIDKYVDKQILFMTPIKRYDGARDAVLREIVDAIIEVCGHYGIPVLDAYREISLNMDIPSQYDALFADEGGHPNQAGHEVMARRVTGYLKQLA